MSEVVFGVGAPYWALALLGLAGLALLALLTAPHPSASHLLTTAQSLASTAQALVANVSCEYYVLVNYSMWVEKPAPGAKWRPALVLPSAEPGWWKLCYKPADSTGYPQYGPAGSQYWWRCVSRDYGAEFVAGERGHRYLMVLRKGCCGGWGWVLVSP